MTTTVAARHVEIEPGKRWSVQGEFTERIRPHKRHTVQSKTDMCRAGQYLRFVGLITTISPDSHWRRWRRRRQSEARRRG